MPGAGEHSGDVLAPVSVLSGKSAEQAVVLEAEVLPGHVALPGSLGDVVDIGEGHVNKRPREVRPREVCRLAYLCPFDNLGATCPCGTAVDFDTPAAVRDLARLDEMLDHNVLPRKGCLSQAFNRSIFFMLTGNTSAIARFVIFPRKQSTTHSPNRCRCCTKCKSCT